MIFQIIMTYGSTGFSGGKSSVKVAKKYRKAISKAQLGRSDIVVINQSSGGIVTGNTKYHDPDIGGADTTTPRIVSLCDLSEGNTQTTRGSRKVFWIKGITLDYKLVNTSNASTGAQTTRIVVVWDKSPQGANPAWTDVFRSTSLHGLFNYDQSDRFNIVYDRVHILGAKHSANNYVGGGPLAIHVKEFLKIANPKSRVTKYDANVGDVTDIVGGAFFMLTYNTNGAGSGTTMTGLARLRFVDL